MALVFKVRLYPIIRCSIFAAIFFAPLISPKKVLSETSISESPCNLNCSLKVPLQALTSDDQILRLAAIKKAREEEFLNDEIIDALIASINLKFNEEIRAEAAYALGQFHVQRALKTLKEIIDPHFGCLTYTSDYGTTAAIYALKQLGTPEADEASHESIAKLITILENPNYYSSKVIISSLSIFADTQDQWPLSQKTKARIKTLLYTADLTNKWYALLALKNIDDKQDRKLITENLRKLSLSPEFLQSDDILYILRDFKETVAVNGLFLAARKHKMSEERLTALLLLSEMPRDVLQSKKLFSYLIGLLNHREMNFRGVAIDILGQIGNPDAYAPLIKIMENDPELSLRPSAAVSLAKLPKVNKNALNKIANIVFSNNEFSDNAVRALALIKPEGTPFLIKALSDSNDKVRSRAAFWITKEKIDSPEIIEALINVVESEQDPYVIGDIANALISVNARGVGADHALIVAAKKGSLARKKEVLLRIAQSGLAEGEELLILLLKDEDVFTRFNAADALSKINSKKAKLELDEFNNSLKLIKTKVKK